MEKFKHIIRRRIGLVVIYNSVLLVICAIGTPRLIENRTDFFAGFVLGISIAIELIGIIFIIKYSKVIKNEEKLKKLYILETDERRKFIQTKIGGTGISIVVAGLALATVTFGYFNDTIFIALLGATVFSTLVKVVLKLYYTQKY